MGNQHPNYSEELAHHDGDPVWASHEPDGYVCPFCQLAAGTADDPANRCELSDLVYQDADVLVFIACDGFGPHAGHAMITPVAHREALYDLDDDQLTKVSLFSRHVALAIKLAWNSPGTSVRQHNEPAGNQHVWHYHLHVFPRYEDDMLYRQIRHPLEVEFRAQKARELKAALAQVLAAAE
ncbi:HIT family protein [Garicola koreensis]|uniref:Histidine triad (HIT) family protein n=1 Tax=Garicola koreensis TaxID=1262554 RepID=A0A7W5TR49_9MICC|nr:HIT family protein [Garicola koreensis]MBB3668261.1 histidine triad (HIT) family protein [Garicola koreensis]